MVLPVARLVEGGRHAGTRRVAAVDVVSMIHLAACCGHLTGGASWFQNINAARLSPDLALGRGHPVPRQRRQHEGCGSAFKVEIRPLSDGFGPMTKAELCGVHVTVTHDLCSCHCECPSAVDTSTIKSSIVCESAPVHIERAGVVNGTTLQVHSRAIMVRNISSPLGRRLTGGTGWRHGWCSSHVPERQSWP